MKNERPLTANLPPWQTPWANFQAPNGAPRGVLRGRETSLYDLNSTSLMKTLCSSVVLMAIKISEYELTAQLLFYKIVWFVC